MIRAERTICVVGLGYVGLPLACLLARHFKVFGYDRDARKIDELKKGVDRTGEVENLEQFNIEYSSSAAIISQANFIILAVPTPIAEDLKPDLSSLESASETVGQHLKAGSIVVYESTVYPGCTEEVCLPILEHSSGLKAGQDFFVGYSPERVNPGDKQHTIDKVTKVVSGQDEETLEIVAGVYGRLTNVHKASSIKVAEAAKVIENVQRDLNIALMNELALIFDKIGIDTKEVIAAAGTKWNFHTYAPGLVGGHCIGVDPYYLTYKAQQLGYEPKIILAGRSVNEYMAAHVAEKLSGAKKVLILGVTFKENVPDIRNSKARDLAQSLQKQGAEVFAYDPLVSEHQDFGTPVLAWPPSEHFDAIVVFSPHQVFKDLTLDQLKNVTVGAEPILFDVKGIFNRAEVLAAGFRYLTL